MENMHRKKLFFWIGLVLIVVFYSLYFLLFLYRIAQDMPIRGRHIVKLLFIVLTYVTGVVCLKRYAEPWMMRIWHGFYLLILCLLLCLGAYDWTIARTPLSVREIADSLQEFLVSPVLYVALGIFNRRAQD
jgi:hypothetical protein